MKSGQMVRLITILLAHAIIPVCFTFPFSLLRFILPRSLAHFSDRQLWLYLNSLFTKDSLHLLVLCLLYRNFYSYSGSLGANTVRTDIPKCCIKHLVNLSDSNIATFIRLTFKLLPSFSAQWHQKISNCKWFR